MESALCLTDAQWEALYGVCTHYLMATAWVGQPGQPTASAYVIERRAVAQRILDTKEG